jgi:hypothetical protein
MSDVYSDAMYISSWFRLLYVYSPASPVFKKKIDEAEGTKGFSLV